jgi:hypothetical protein
MALGSALLHFHAGRTWRAELLVTRCGQALEEEKHLNQAFLIAFGSLDPLDADGVAEHARLRELSEPTVEVGVLGLDHGDQFLGCLLVGEGASRDPAAGAVGLGIALLVGRRTHQSTYAEHQEENDECGDSTVYEHRFSFA